MSRKQAAQAQAKAKLVSNQSSAQSEQPRAPNVPKTAGAELKSAKSARRASCTTKRLRSQLKPSRCAADAEPAKRTRRAKPPIGAKVARKARPGPAQASYAASAAEPVRLSRSGSWLL